MTLNFARVNWFDSKKNFGVAGLLINGSPIGIHKDRGRIFYRGTNKPELRPGGRRLTTDPKEGDEICLIVGGKSRKGNPFAELWGMAEDWELAGHEICERYIKLENFDRHRQTLEADLNRAREDHRLRSPASKLPWGFEEACFAIQGADIRRASWHMVSIGFLWLKGGREMARGCSDKVQMLETETQGSAVFTAGEAEYLWEQADKSNLGSA
ncbi:MAG: hypothetical protein ABI643_00770 [Candidatus Doudnabacteria bacterium]